MTWHSLTPTDDTFFDTAALVSTHVVDVPVPVEDLWAALAADDAVVGWGLGATSMRWLTPRPFGVDTVREVTLAGAVKVRERFYRWDENKRMTFFVSECNRPGITSFAEDYVAESTASGSRLTWVVAVHPSRTPAPLRPLLGKALDLAIGSMASGLRKKLS